MKGNIRILIDELWKYGKNGTDAEMGIEFYLLIKRL